ncbi:MAG: hypothetical protein ACFB3T_11180 [Geminicoccaceae bacterium]
MFATNRFALLLGTSLVALPLAINAPLAAEGSQTDGSQAAEGAMLEEAAQNTGYGAEEAWYDFRSFTYEQSERAQQAGETMLENIDRQLAAINERAENQSDDFNEAWELRREELQQWRETIANQLEALGDATADGYNDAKDAIGSAYESAVSALNETWQDMTS